MSNKKETSSQLKKKVQNLSKGDGHNPTLRSTYIGVAFSIDGVDRFNPVLYSPHRTTINGVKYEDGTKQSDPKNVYKVRSNDLEVVDDLTLLTEAAHIKKAHQPKDILAENTHVTALVTLRPDFVDILKNGWSEQDIHRYDHKKPVGYVFPWTVKPKHIQRIFDMENISGEYEREHAQYLIGYVFSKNYYEWIYNEDELDDLFNRHQFGKSHQLDDDENPYGICLPISEQTYPVDAPPYRMGKEVDIFQASQFFPQLHAREVFHDLTSKIP